MGEYVNGWKIGTCEELYYIRYDELMRLKNQGVVNRSVGNLSVEEYLDEKHAWRYRFPFPNEDRQFDEMGLEACGKRNYTDAIVLPSPVGLIECEHKTICKGIQPVNLSGYNVNVFLPCPMDGNKAKAVSMSPRTYDIWQIVAERCIDGKPVTVMRCGYCGNTFRLGVDEAKRIRSFISEEIIAKMQACAETSRVRGDTNHASSDMDTAQYWAKVRDRIHGQVDERLFPEGGIA